MADEDVAKLGLEVDSKGLEDGTDKLKEFAETAKDAGKSADDASGKFVGLGSAASDTGGKFTKAADGAKSVVSGMQDAAESAKKVADATGKAADAAAKLASVGTSATGGKLTESLKDLGKTAETTGQKASDMVRAARNMGLSLDDYKKQVLGGASATDDLADASVNAAKSAAEQSGAFDKIKTAVAGMTNAQLGAVTVVAALGVAAAAAAVGAGVLAYQWSTAQIKIEQALIGIGARTGTTISDINRFSFANASATGLSVDQARDAAIEFTKTGNIAVGSLSGLGEAVHGFAVLTGTDATKATQALAKALSGDLVKGAQDLDKIYGSLDGRTLEYIADLQASGQSTKAQQVIIDSMAAANQKAAESVDILSKAWGGLGNVLSTVKNAIPNALAGGPLEERISAAKTRVSDLQTPRLGSDNQNVTGGAGSAELKQAEADLQKLQDEFNKIDARNAIAQMQKVALGADAVVKAVFPQIDQLRNLQAELGKLKAAQDNNGGFQGQSAGNDAAATALQNQKALVEEAFGQAVRYNDAVAEIAKSWGDVGISTALAAQKMDNQLPVAQAVGNAAKMQAQYQATINDLLDKGKTLTEATLVATKQYELSQAAAIAAAQQSTKAMEDQNELAKARTEEEKKLIAARQEYNKVLDATGSPLEAEKARLAVIDRYNISIEQNARKRVAAYRAAADAAEQEAQAMLRAAQASAQAWQDMEDAKVKAAGGQDNLAFAAKTSSQTYTSSNLIGSGGAYYKSGGGGKRLDNTPTLAVMQQMLKQTPIDWSSQLGKQTNAILTAGGSVLSAIANAQNLTVSATAQPTQISTVQALYDLLNKQTTDKTAQASNLQQELAWLNTLPQTLETQSKIADLTNSINSLTSSTDSLNSTMGDVLSPYYTQDPRTSHLGFRAPGMALGGYVDVPGGISTNDNMIAQIPVASGERITVDPMPSKRGVGGSTFNITVNAPIYGNANKDEVGRTMYQAGQSMARQLQATAR